MAGATEINDPHLNHLFDGTELNVYSDKVINLSAGAPGPDLLRLCIDLFREATAHRLEGEKDHAYLFQYGITSGMWEFREELSKFLSKRYGEAVLRENLVLTCGATHGLQLAMGTFLWPNSIIFVEDVTYMIALDAFKQYPLMKIVPVPITSNGIDTEAMEKIVSDEKSKGTWLTNEDRPFWAMLYTIPFFQNPTGISMSERTCEKVVYIARKYDILIFCDDVYNLLHFTGTYPPKRLFSYDFKTDGFKGGHVISNGTFSKIMAPGVRVGWMELPPRLTKIVRQSGIMLSGGATNQYVSGVVTSILSLGLQDKHLDYIKMTLKDRMDILYKAFDMYLPKECSFVKSYGGYFVWVKLPHFIKASEFIKWCIENYKITAIPGSRFSVDGKYINYLRLSIAFHNKDILADTAPKLCAAINEYILVHGPNKEGGGNEVI